MIGDHIWVPRFCFVWVNRIHNTGKNDIKHRLKFRGSNTQIYPQKYLMDKVHGYKHKFKLELINNKDFQ
jgi:hypothetical protein